MKKILIIEDDQIVANIYRAKFSTEGYEVETAGDGESGLELINSFRPHVIILDLMLPKVPGLDLLKKVRARNDLQQLPIIVLSNTYLSNMVQEAWKAGATKCLSKANCTPKQVIEVVRGVMPQTGAAAASSRRAAPETDEAESDAGFQAEIREAFLKSLPATLAGARTVLQHLAKNTDEASRVNQLQELYRRIHALANNAGIAGTAHIAQLGDALEALLKELYEKPRNINASTLRTVALAIDFLGVLYERTGRPEPASPAQSSILVVDDEAISRRAVTYALEKAKLKAASVDNPEAALQLLAERTFDLVFLDVDMPGMNGFELCTKLRALHRNKNTPVVFVTSLTDFESRANSTISGGNDLIAKPFLFIELTVKALVYILRGRPPK